MIEPAESRPSIVKRILGLLVGVPFLLMLAYFFLLGPYQLLVASYDLLRMDQQSIADIKTVKVVRGDRGTSRTDITYSFHANGQLINSNRVFASPADNSTYTGGSAPAKKYTVGMKAKVYFDSNDARCCCLELGWHKIAVGMTMLTWGIAASIFCFSKSSKYLPIPFSCVIYGFGLFIFGPQVVVVTQLHYHLMAFALITVTVIIYSYFRPISKTENTDSGSPFKVDSAAEH